MLEEGAAGWIGNASVRRRRWHSSQGKIWLVIRRTCCGTRRCDIAHASAAAVCGLGGAGAG